MWLGYFFLKFVFNLFTIYSEVFLKDDLTVHIIVVLHYDIFQILWSRCHILVNFQFYTEIWTL